jgi:hypothetical protein
MSEIRGRWLEAGECFAELGRRYRQHQEAQQVLALEPDDRDRLHEAVGGAIEAVDAVLVAAGRTVGDESLRADAEEALGALRNALEVTFTEAGAEIEAAAERIRLGLRRLPDLEDDLASRH